MLLDVLATHRLVRLVTKDVITGTPRAWVIRHAYERHGDPPHQALYPAYWEQRVELDDHAPKLATLITCRWCTSVYVAFGVVIVRRFRWWPFVRDALALSSASTLVAGLERE